jgi:hypothetical protein
MSKSLILAVVAFFSLNTNAAFAKDRASAKARPKTNVAAAAVVAPPVKAEDPKVEAPASKPIAVPSLVGSTDTLVVRMTSDTPHTIVAGDSGVLCELPCSPTLNVGGTYEVRGGVSLQYFRVRSDAKTMQVKGGSDSAKTVATLLLVGSGVLATTAGVFGTYATSTSAKAEKDYNAGKISLGQWRSELDSTHTPINIGLGLLVSSGVCLVAGIVVLIAAPGTDVKLNGGTKSASRVRPLANGFAF